MVGDRGTTGKTDVDRYDSQSEVSDYDCGSDYGSKSGSVDIETGREVSRTNISHDRGKPVRSYSNPTNY